MNAGIERAMNFDNLGERITKNGVMDQKIQTLETFRGKTVFSGSSGVILEILEWLEGFGAKDRGSCEIWEFFGDFVDFWSAWSGLGPNHIYFSKPRALL
jgi:hypothetical protein